MIRANCSNDDKFIHNEECKKSVLELVEINGMNLRFLSEKYRNDVDVVIAAYKNNKESIIYASHSIQSNIELILRDYIHN
jgi:hypothetical protein